MVRQEKTNKKKRIIQEFVVMFKIRKDEKMYNEAQMMKLLIV